MSNEISLSLEETNKLRVSIGLKPIDSVVEKIQVKTEEQKPPQVSLQEKKKRSKVPGIDLDDDKLDDTDDWLSGLSTKKIVPEKVVDVKSYSSQDLKGIKIGHSIQDIGNLKDGVVLTLKDGDVLDEENEEDELQAESLVNQKKVQDDLRAKTGKDDSKYKGYYDDQEQEEEKDNSFMLNGGEIDTNKEQEPEELKTSLKNKRQIVLSEEEQEESTDYQPAKPVKMKKLKKTGQNKKRTKYDTIEPDRVLSYVDLKTDDLEDVDDELQSVLSFLRKKKLQKRKMSPEEYVESQLRNVLVKREENVSEGLVLDETTDFLNNIKKEDTETASAKVKMEPVETASAKIKLEPVETEQTIKKEEQDFIPKEQDFDSGLGSTLKLLQQRKILNKQDSESKEIKQRQRELLREKQLLDIEKLAGEDSRKLKEINQRQLELLSNYNPVVQLKYHDDKGNSLTTKEAYKQLSHQFHGKAPSNNKMEKILKKRQNHE